MIGLIVFSVLFLCLDQCTKRFAVVHTSQRSLALGRLLKLRCVRNPLTKLRGASHPRRFFRSCGSPLSFAPSCFTYAGWFHGPQAALAGLALAFAGAAGNLARPSPP